MTHAHQPDGNRPGRAPAEPTRSNGGGGESAGQPNAGPAQPWWQWLVAGAGAVLLLGTVGDLVYDGMVPTDGPPMVGLAVARIERLPDGGYVAIVRAMNRGGRAAAGLKIEGELRRAGAPAETREFTLDYLPTGSSREGGLFFAHDPRSPGAELVLHPSGYNKP